MASNGLSSFSSNGGGGWTNLGTPKYARVTVSKPSSQSHGILHNLLGDIRSAASGIPMGLIDSGKALGEAAIGNYHPAENMLKGAYHSYGYLYGPAFHHHFGTTLHRMGQHPLQPILDVLSVASLPVGGIGLGVKGADLAAASGERLGVVSAERAAQIKRAADFFRPSTSMVGVAGDPLKPVHWDANPMRRAFQGLNRGTQKVLAAHAPTLFGEEGKAFDLTAAGQQKRWVSSIRSARKQAASAQMSRELHSVRSLFKTRADPKTIADAIAPHIDDVMVSHAFKMPDYTLKSLKGKNALNDGWAFLSKTGKYAEYPADNTTAEFGNWITNYTSRKLTRKPQRALQDEHGNYLVVRTKGVQDLRDEAVNTHKVLKGLYDTPTKIWKWMVLATAPRYFVNNVVGNGLMTAMAANPISTTRAMYHTIRQLHGQKVADRSLSDVEKAQRQITGDSLDKWYMAQTEGFGHEVTRDLQLHEKFQNPTIRKGVKIAQGGLFEITHHVSDTLPRRALFNMFLKRNPEYQAYYRAARKEGMASGASHDYAIDKASENYQVRDWATQQVDNILGQYHHFNALERGIKRIIPFYSWNRAIVRHSFHLASGRPAAAAALYQAGMEGAAHTEKILGSVPDFMKGFIPLSAMGLGEHALDSSGILGLILGGETAGRVKALSTQGLNPYSSVPDVADFVATGAAGNPQAGESLASQINPIITGVIEHYTGQSLLSGKKLPQHGGLFQDVASNVAETTPIFNVLKPLINGTPRPRINAQTGKIGSPLLYKGDERQQLLSVLGAPVKDLNEASAHRLFNTQEGVKVVHLPKVHLTTTKGGDGLSSFKAIIHQATKPSKPHKPEISHGSSHASKHIRKPSLRRSRNKHPKIIHIPHVKTS